MELAESQRIDSIIIGGSNAVAQSIVSALGSLMRKVFNHRRATGDGGSLEAVSNSFLQGKAELFS